MELTIPFPPSLNHYYRRVGARTLISRAGRRYREAVRAALGATRRTPMAGRLRVSVTLHAPDRRRRDLDNSMKSLLDALAHGGVYQDDSQIDRLEVVRGTPMRGGACVVAIMEAP